jgi:hypothetical protein
MNLYVLQCRQNGLDRQHNSGTPLVVRRRGSAELVFVIFLVFLIAMDASRRYIMTSIPIGPLPQGKLSLDGFSFAHGGLP